MSLSDVAPKNLSARFPSAPIGDSNHVGYVTKADAVLPDGAAVMVSVTSDQGMARSVVDWLEHRFPTLEIAQQVAGLPWGCGPAFRLLPEPSALFPSRSHTLIREPSRP
jgi:hypothetical protein